MKTRNLLFVSLLGLTALSGCSKANFKKLEDKGYNANYLEFISAYNTATGIIGADTALSNVLSSNVDTDIAFVENYTSDAKSVCKQGSKTIYNSIEKGASSRSFKFDADKQAFESRISSKGRFADYEDDDTYDYQTNQIYAVDENGVDARFDLDLKTKETQYVSSAKSSFNDRARYNIYNTVDQFLYVFNILSTEEDYDKLASKVDVALYINNNEVFTIELKGDSQYIVEPTSSGKAHVVRQYHITNGYYSYHEVTSIKNYVSYYGIEEYRFSKYETYRDSTILIGADTVDVEVPNYKEASEVGYLGNIGFGS